MGMNSQQESQQQCINKNLIHRLIRLFKCQVDNTALDTGHAHI